MERLAPTEYQIFKANVIKNSLNKADNYITLDRGTTEGIRPEMGVVDANGVVGIVYKTSPHYSLVIPLLNSKSSISCKIVGSDYFGYLKWEGGNSRFAYLKDLPRHAEFNLGDTVVTSGYSTVFPEGVMVGTVDDMSALDSNAFCSSCPLREMTRTLLTFPKSVASFIFNRYESPSCESDMSSTVPTMTPSGNTVE